MNDQQLSRPVQYGIEREWVEPMTKCTREHTERIIDALHEPLLVLDNNNVILSANRSFYNLFHLAPWRTEGRSLVDLAVGEWNIPNPQILVEMARNQDNSPNGHELRHTFPAIGRRVMLLNVRSVPAVSGVPDLLLFSFLDITELTRVQETVVQANKKLNLLNSITRHDILNHLTVILGYLEILDGADPSKIKPEYLSRIESASTAIKKQIQFTAEYQDIGTSPPLWHKMQDVILRAGSSLRRYGVTLHCDLNGLEVYADALIERVFSNLFENSLNHGVTVTEITVSSQLTGDGSMVLVIEDNGQGVSEELKEKIFSMGYGSHTGYGLFLIREILDTTGITIRETGIPPGGARFEMRIPEGIHRTPQG